jgi:hypothetical protein
MTEPEVHYLPLTRAEADAYVYGIERVTQVWYAGNRKDRHLTPKSVHAYNAIRKLISQLKEIAYSGFEPPSENGMAFDLELMRDNERESRTLDGDRRGMPETDETE